MTLAIGTYVSIPRKDGQENGRIVHTGGNMARMYRKYRVWRPEEVVEWQPSDAVSEKEPRSMTAAQIAAMPARPSGVMKV